MKPQSAKAKGRLLQKWFAELITKTLNLDPLDVESRPMGPQGEDIILGSESRKKFPLSVECKNQEAVNVWKAYEQCSSNTSKNVESLVIIKRKVAIINCIMNNKLHIFFVISISCLIFSCS